MWNKFGMPKFGGLHSVYEKNANIRYPSDLERGKIVSGGYLMICQNREQTGISCSMLKFQENENVRQGPFQAENNFMTIRVRLINSQ